MHKVRELMDLCMLIKIMQWEMVEIKSAYMYRWKRQGIVKKLQDIIKKKGWHWW